VLWFDLDYTKDSQYFKFDLTKFPVDQHEEMNKQIFDSQRRFVVITDPHIRAISSNPVYSTGVALEGDQ
jgi:alpha-glucosidase (family GH31 glycosyl hydrolase)